MEPIKTLLVDDEPLARSRLRRLLAQHPQFEVVGECADGNSAVDAVRDLAPELLLLDIQMPQKDGFDVVEALGDNPLPLVIFVTAYDEHALRAFEACALDYLLKPVTAERLARALARVPAQLAAARRMDAQSSSNAPLRFHVRNGQRTSFVSPDEIDWIQADGNYATLHVDAENYLLRATMSALERDLPQTFMRTCRSSIVNLQRVKELQATGANHFVVIKDNARVPVTVGVRALQQRLRAL